MKVAETDIGRPVVEYLRADGWEVYQEVSFGSKSADIVATRDRLVWVIELKKSVGFAVLDQAIEWTAYADLVSVAGPRPKSRDGRALWTVLNRWGIGVLNVELSSLGPDYHHVRVDTAAKLHREGRKRGRYGREALLGALNEDNRTRSIAGSRSGKVMTPFKRTCEAVIATLRTNGPMTTKELVAALDHHYASDTSARSSLLHWAGRGPLSEVELVGTYRPVWKLKEKTPCA